MGKIKMVPKLMQILEGGPFEDGDEEFDVQEVVKKEGQWHVVDPDKNRWGPMSTKEVIELKTKKKINRFAKVWNGTTVKSWTKIPEVKEFKELFGDDLAPGDGKDAGDGKDDVFTGFKKMEDPFKKYRWNCFDTNNKKHENIDFDELEKMFKVNKTLNTMSYVQNGVTIKLWTRIKDDKPLLERLTGKKVKHGFNAKDGAVAAEKKQPAKLAPGNWYAMGKQKQKLGPMNSQQLNAFVKQDDQVNIRSLVWNGTTVKEWTPYLKV